MHRVVGVLLLSCLALPARADSSWALEGREPDGTRFVGVVSLDDAGGAYVATTRERDGMTTFRRGAAQRLASGDVSIRLAGPGLAGSLLPAGDELLLRPKGDELTGTLFRGDQVRYHVVGAREPAITPDPRGEVLVVISGAAAIRVREEDGERDHPTGYFL